MSRTRILLAPCTAVISLACGTPSPPATGQILLYVDTDAPVASPSNPRLGPTDPIPLFDTVRIDIYAPGASLPCSGCTNDFGLDSDALEAGASVGLALPPSVAGYRARVRLYEGAFASSLGEPDPASTVDMTVALPPVTAGVVDSETVVLLTEDVAKHVGSLAAPVPTTKGHPSSLVGSWAPAKRTACPGVALPDEVCIPGGAYWMGNPAVASVLTDDEGTTVRLVILSPFFLKTAEVTVAEFRAAGLSPAAPWTGSGVGDKWADWCTYASSPRDCTLVPCEDDPVNCVSPEEALSYCKMRGGELPSEAQFEYVAGGLQAQVYVWGEDPPTCPDAMYGATSLSAPLTASIVAFCPVTDKGIGGPSRAGSGRLDRLALPGGTVLDLAGNLTEWTSDLWNRSSEACWSRTGIYTDPSCTTPSPSDGKWNSTRGGAWLGEPVYLQAAVRSYAAGSPQDVTPSAGPDVGFRCVRSEKP